MNSKRNHIGFQKQEFYKNSFFLLLIIGITSLIFRLYFLPLDVPFLSDAFLYFSYAHDLNITNQFPNGYNFTNNGWPTLIGIIFNFFPTTDLIQLMNAQRIISVIISTLTIIPAYYLCKRFFSNNLALIGVCIFIFEPRIIINSLLGITDPLYIFLIASSLALFFSKNKNYLYLSFACIAFSILVRYEGIIWFGILSVLFFIHYKSKFNYRVILKYFLIIGISFLIIFPMLHIRTETMGSDQISSVIQGSFEDIDVRTSGENQISSFFGVLGNGILNLLKYLGWIMIPYLLIFMPLGTIFSLKSKDPNTKFLIFSVIVVLSTSVLYAYFRGIQDTRYFYPLYPIFVVLGLYFIKEIFEKVKNKKIITTLILLGILASSIVFLEIKSIDIEHEKESIAIFEDVYSITKTINKFNHESGYIHSIPILKMNEPIVLAYNKEIVKTIPYDDSLNLKEFIILNQDYGLKHIVVDDKKDRPEFFKKLIEDDTSFSYLEKIYDSKNFGFKYHVKVFKINFEKLS